MKATKPNLNRSEASPTPQQDKAESVAQPEVAESNLADEYKAAHYSASIQAWFGTKMEKDKSLLTLASAGIGILVSLGATSRIEKICYISAISFFIFTVFCALVVFEINAKLIESIILENKPEKVGKIAQILDYSLILSFLFGVIAFAMLGIARFMIW